MLIAVAVLAILPTKPAADTLADAFRNPPASARPHTWWHWMNGNVTKEGITADLEAMKQAGIGGAQMFTVDQGIPHGPADYNGPLWHELTAHAIKEAGRLGIELCLHNCAGWSSSGGPWIKPEDAMQVIAWSELHVQGPQSVHEILPQPKAPHLYARVPYYKDIAVYAFPTPPGTDKPADFLGRTGVERADGLEPALIASPNAITQNVIDLTSKLDADGRLTWDAPAGNWTILRMGHVPTGKDNHPAPPEGDGLEVDKLSKEALDKHWAGLMAKVIKDAGPLAGKVLNNSLIDSYEVGSQNWTPKFREEFRKRRGYDPMPFLPTIAGYVLGSKERTERFLWDLRRTIADLYADNYYGHFAELCHKAGLKFSTEPYGNGGFDTIQSGSKADIPMGEFWIGGSAMETAKLASSVGHVYGHEVVGAESFTADDVRGRWLESPYEQKALGDWAFCEGINRYIFHRYAQQPWLDLKPGMTMGPWGTHLERTQTWWTEAGTWLKYVARCQYLLQSGKFVADAVYYYGENSPQDLPSPPQIRAMLPAGYDYDGCDANALLSMKVRNGKVVLPSGMTYSVLILPNSKFMTPRVARKVRDLVQAGAMIVGPKPSQSPSLQGYPACDREVRDLAEEAWSSTGNQVHAEAKLSEIFKTVGVAPDFNYAPRNYANKLIDIHRRIGDTDVYFVSNQNYRNTKVDVTFRVKGRIPELWHADTGKVENAAAYTQIGSLTTVPLNLGPAESVFVVFRKPAPKFHLASFTSGNRENTPRAPQIEILSARYGSADGRGVDVTAKVKDLVNAGDVEVPATNSNFGDPVFNVVKQLVVEYRVGGKLKKQTVPENDVVKFVDVPVVLNPPSYEIAAGPDQSVVLTPWQPGNYSASYVTGPLSIGGGVRPSSFIRQIVRSVRVTDRPLSLDLSRNWALSFPPKLGAPASASFDKLISWPDSEVTGIKYFSGSAIYKKDFDLPASFTESDRSIRLNLGEVKNFATVTVNGRQVAVLWKPPFALDITDFVRPGRNHVEIKVTNLWPNRIIGDEQLPPDVEWNGAQLRRWPDWLVNHQPRPKTGRITFTTWHYYNKNSPLLPSGMLGPVTIQSAKRRTIRY